MRSNSFITAKFIYSIYIVVLSSLDQIICNGLSEWFKFFFPVIRLHYCIYTFVFFPLMLLPHSIASFFFLTLSLL